MTIREPQEPVYRKCEDAIADYGYVVTEKDAAVAGNVKLVDADGEHPFGIAKMRTEDPITGLSVANKSVAIARSGEALVRLIATNVTIAPGDPLGTKNGGYVDKLTPAAATEVFAPADVFTALRPLVGEAQEAKASSVGGTIKCRLGIVPTGL